MSNNFPDVPADLQLKSITYMVSFDGPVGGGVIFGPAFTFDGANTNSIGALAALGGAGGIQFTFGTPGVFGTFDQDAAEAELTSVIGAIFQLMSVISGIPVADMADDVAVERVWTWTGSGGSTATYTDTMPLTLPAST